MTNKFQIGDLVKLRANQNLCGYIEYITDDKFCYVIWFKDKNSIYPYAFSSLIKVS